MSPERKRSRKEKGRSNNYSSRVHFVNEMSRRELRKERKAELRQGLNPHAGEDSGVGPEPIDMEPGRDYPIG